MDARRLELADAVALVLCREIGALLSSAESSGGMTRAACTAPDIITLYDARTYEPLTNEGLEERRGVSASPRPPRRSPRG